MTFSLNFFDFLSQFFWLFVSIFLTFCLNFFDWYCILGNFQVLEGIFMFLRSNLISFLINWILRTFYYMRFCNFTCKLFYIQSNWFFKNIFNNQIYITILFFMLANLNLECQSNLYDVCIIFSFFFVIYSNVISKW